MLRLTIASQSDEEVVLKVDGWLTRDSLDLLEREGMCYLRESKHLVLDLQGVRFIDQAGIAFLQQWSGERLALRGGSLFVRMLLKDNGLE